MKELLLLQVFDWERADPRRAYKPMTTRHGNGGLLRPDMIDQKAAREMVNNGGIMVRGYEVPLTRSADGLWLVNDQNTQALEKSGGLWTQWSDTTALMVEGSQEWVLRLYTESDESYSVIRQAKRLCGHVHSRFQLSKSLGQPGYEKATKLSWAAMFISMPKGSSLWCNGHLLTPDQPWPLAALFG